MNLCKRSQVHANANQPYDSLIPPKNKNEGVHFRADTGVRPYDFKFPEVGVTPCGYPSSYAVMEGEIEGTTDSGLEERILPSIRRSQIVLIYRNAGVDNAETFGQLACSVERPARSG